MLCFFNQKFMVKLCSKIDGHDFTKSIVLCVVDHIFSMGSCIVFVFLCVGVHCFRLFFIYVPYFRAKIHNVDHQKHHVFLCFFQ